MINREMARHGILLFTFGLILSALKEVSQAPISLMPSPIPPPPDFFCMLSRVILIIITFYAAIRVWRAYKSAKFLKGHPKWLMNFIANMIIVLLILFIIWLAPPIPLLPIWIFRNLGIITLLASLIFVVAIFCKWLADRVKSFLERQQSIYWLIFWAVSTVSWLKGLLGITSDRLTFTIAGYVGVIWFIAITIIVLRITQRPSTRPRKIRVFIVQHVESPEEANPP